MTKLHLLSVPLSSLVEYAAKAGADRVELYTGPYAALYDTDPEAAIAAYRPAAEKAHQLGLVLMSRSLCRSSQKVEPLALQLRLKAIGCLLLLMTGSKRSVQWMGN